jgi:IS30 family transposase
LSFAVREQLALLAVQGWSVRAMAAELGFSPATISRELRRGRRTLHGPYVASVAQALADQRGRRPKPARLAVNEPLRAWVQNRLEQGDSPEQISHRLRRDFPDDPEMRVSPETIYQSLYVQGRGALKRELTACLRTGRALRKPRRSTESRIQRIPGLVSISERPPEARDRAVPGHWEGDLIVGADSKSAIGTLVERTTGFVMLLHLPERHTADEVEAEMIRAMTGLPDRLRQTLTWDRGGEMANHAKITDATGLRIYFADPRSPWQRATNENTNGLLRQYFPKGTDLSVFPRDYLDFIALRLNNRPRKRHDWLTPAEVLDELLSNPPQPPPVALTA